MCCVVAPPILHWCDVPGHLRSTACETQTWLKGTPSHRLAVASSDFTGFFSLKRYFISWPALCLAGSVRLPSRPAGRQASGCWWSPVTIRQQQRQYAEISEHWVWTLAWTRGNSHRSQVLLMDRLVAPRERHCFGHSYYEVSSDTYADKLLSTVYKCDTKQPVYRTQ